MNINLQDIGKKFGKTWVFRHITQEIPNGSKLALIGNNGSGKSTLLQIIAGFIAPNQGKLVYKQIEDDEVYKQIAYCAPYLDLLEDLTLGEMVDFHDNHKPLVTGVSADSIITELGFDPKKYIKEYSSGMKQRLKLLLCFYSDVPILLLDEPTSNLDEQGISWYQDLVATHLNGRTIIVASNEKREYEFCEASIDVREFKSK